MHTHAKNAHTCRHAERTPIHIGIIFLLCSGAWEYIESTRNMVRDLERCVRLAKVNVETAIDIMAKWCQKPLYQRKEDKKDSLLNLEVLL